MSTFKTVSDVIWCIGVSSERRQKSFSAPIVGLSACSLFAADTTDTTTDFKPKCPSIFQWLSIHTNMLLYASLISLASWLQPRWVVEAPAQDQSLRLTKEKVARAETPTWSDLQYILCRRDDAANWHLSLVVAETWKHLKTYAALRCFEYMLAHWPVCDLLSKHHRAMVLPAWSVVTCPKIQRKTPKLIMPFHSLWPRDYCTSKIIEMPRENWLNKMGILLHDNVRNIATIPMVFGSANSSWNQLVRLQNIIDESVNIRRCWIISRWIPPPFLATKINFHMS